MTAETAGILRQELESCMREIERELSRADSLQFKPMLKQRRESLEHIFAKLAAAPLAA